MLDDDSQWMHRYDESDPVELHRLTFRQRLALRRGRRRDRTVVYLEVTESRVVRMKSPLQPTELAVILQTLGDDVRNGRFPARAWQRGE